MYYEQDMSVSEIIKTLELKLDEKEVYKTLQKISLILTKKEKGLKTPSFTPNQIEKFYEEHHDELSEHEKTSFQIFISALKDRKNNNAPKASSLINCAILKCIYPNRYFRLSKATKNDIIEFLKEYKFHFPKSSRDALMRKFEIEPEELLTDEEKSRLVVLFSNTKPLEKKMSMKKVEN